MTIKILPFIEMQPMEFYDCFKLRSDVFVVEQKCIYPDIDSIDKTANHLLAYDKNELVGYLRIYTKVHSFSTIGRVVIKEEYRGQGYAQKIMRSAIDYIKSNHSNSAILISAQEYLKDFYQKLDFKQNGDSYLDYGIPHINMQLNLKNDN